jgi:hypothetical protein
MEINLSKKEKAFLNRYVQGAKALNAIKDFLEWGAKTGSDRELFNYRFRKILTDAEIKFEEPEY